MSRCPCERCGGRLHYHERAQRWCRSCAAALGVDRLCDRGRPAPAQPELRWARERMAKVDRLGAPAAVLDRWDRYIATAEDLMAHGAPESPGDPAMRDWVAERIEDMEVPFP